MDSEDLRPPRPAPPPADAAEILAIALGARAHTASAEHDVRPIGDDEDRGGDPGPASRGPTSPPVR